MERPGTPLLGWARTPGLTDGQFVRNRAGGWGTICDHPGYVQSIRMRYDVRWSLKAGEVAVSLPA